MIGTSSGCKGILRYRSMMIGIFLTAGLFAPCSAGYVSPLPPITIPIHMTKSSFVTAVINDSRKEGASRTLFPRPGFRQAI